MDQQLVGLGSIIQNSKSMIIKSSFYSIKRAIFLSVIFFSSIGISFAQTYPTSMGSNYSYEWITNVTLEDINNTSTGSSYTDYTSGTTAKLAKGSSYTLSVSINADSDDYLLAWIDWNDDGDFTDSGEEFTLVSATASNGPHTTTIVVPSTAVTAITRMRISLKWQAVPTSDETFDYGEVEDYGIELSTNTDLFYYVSDGDDNLYTINKITGTTNLIGATGTSSIEAIANWPSLNGQVLYACDRGNFGTLNTSTGLFTSMGQVDNGGTADGPDGAQSMNDVDGLAFDPRTGVLWASNRRSGDFDLLFQIDPSTGRFVSDIFGTDDYIEIAGSGVYQNFDDIAISPADGVIYGVSNNGSMDQILSITVPTGVVTVVSSLLTATDVEGLAFSMENKMYGIEGAGNDFEEIIWSTGVSITINGSVPGGDVESLAALVEDANLIEGRVYHDDNQNLTDDTEPGLSGVTVQLYYDENGSGTYDGGDKYLTSTVTDGTGNYSFDYAYIGDLVIKVDISTLGSGYSLTTDNIETATFATFANTDSGNDFGADTGSDCDGDGIPDFTEGSIDSDGDGIDNECDLDSDNDGILDSEEITADQDGDGIPNYIDLDSDNDGIPDAIEANRGTAPSGYSSSIGRIGGTDSDSDGLLNSVDNAPTTAYGSGSYSTALREDNDGDGKKDFQDNDSDNDGIMDIIEAGGTDSNNNGEVDSFTDSNSDGYHDALTSSPLPIPNTDSSWEGTYGLATLPNYLDLDSDNDAIDDGKEGYSTADYQTPSILNDTDGDGVLDLYDSNSGGGAIVPNDHDSDGDPDYIDLDSDNDGKPDNIEGNDLNQDNTNDGTWSNADANGNGIDDAFDNNCSGTTNLNLSADDWGEENQSSGNMSLASTDIELVNDGTTHQKVGLHFSAVNVPQGESIVAAYLQFEVDEASTGTVSFTIKGEDENTAASFLNLTDDITDRTLTTASITWAPSDWNTVGENGADQKTGDIKAIVQEIVDRAGWSSGNSMVFVISGADNATNYRTAEVDPILIIQTSGGLSYACGTDIELQDTDIDGEHDFRDDADDTEPLPIVLLEFNATKVNKSVEVDWVTVSEKDNDYFEVQRSENGFDFKVIEIVDGAGTSSDQLNYSIVDLAPLTGVSYYRLHQVDYNGTSTFSNPKRVYFEEELELNIYPNPAHDIVNIETRYKGQIYVYNSMGQLVKQIEHIGDIQTYNFSDLTKGVYTIMYIRGDTRKTKRLLKN